MPECDSETNTIRSKAGAELREFRLAELVDAQELGALVNSVYRGDSAQMGWKTESHLLDGPRITPDGIAALIQQSNAALLRFPANGPLEACVHLEQHQTYAYLGLLSVRLDLQGQGRARKVLESAERFVREQWSLPTVRMTVIAQRTPLIAYYERCGYGPTGDTQPFPYDDPSLGTPKRDDLYFVVLEKNVGEH